MRNLFPVVAIVVSVAVAVLGGLFFLAHRQGPEEDIRSLLASIPESERAALGAVCEAAGFGVDELRPLGVATEKILAAPRNARAVIIRDGHVRLLNIRGGGFTRLPDISALSELETLALEKGQLREWPRLATLNKLTEARFSGQPLSDPPQGVFPASLRRLGLADTNVSRIESLLDLALDELDLSRTPIVGLPTVVPSRGQWLLDLDGTVITSPPGYHARLPSGTTSTEATLPGGILRGMAGHRSVDVAVTGRELRSAVTLALPTNTSLYHTSGTVEVTGRVATGRARLWLQEPEGFFDGPWFRAGKVQGFGFARRTGYVAIEIAPGPKTTGRGALMVHGVPPNFWFTIRIEPVGDELVTDLNLNIRSAP